MFDMKDLLYEGNTSKNGFSFSFVLCDSLKLLLLILIELAQISVQNIVWIPIEP